MRFEDFLRVVCFGSKARCLEYVNGLWDIRKFFSQASHCALYYLKNFVWMPLEKTGLHMDKTLIRELLSGGIEALSTVCSEVGWFWSPTSNWSEKYSQIFWMFLRLSPFCKVVLSLVLSLTVKIFSAKYHFDDLVKTLLIIASKL